MNSQPNLKNRYLNIYFQVHQPRRLGQFSFFDIGSDRDYFDDGTNQLIMRRIAKECYLPTNLLLLKLIHKYPQVRITFSLSGSALKQMERFSPAVVESFQMLASTGSVEFLSETYYP
jgi:alpha-amylase